MSEQKPEGKLTSADIKKQIEEAKEAMKNSGKPLTGQFANEINASESTPEKLPKAEVKPEPEKAAKSVEVAKTTEVDLKEWAKKKGIDWTTEDTVLSALRKSDEQFHRKRQEEKSREQAQPPFVATPPPAYPTYQPPPVNSRQFLENVARDYNMTVEDAERLMKFNHDFYQAVSKQDRERQQKEMEAIRRENQKNSVFRELSSDPVFRDPRVGQEFSLVLEEMQKSDPQSFEQDPNAYKRAYDRTLINIARRDLEGQPLQEGTSLIPKPPTNPPRPLGQGSGGGALENEGAIDPREFAKLSLEDKRRMLDRAGLRPAY